MARGAEDQSFIATDLANGAKVSWTLPAEVPVGLIYGDIPHAVMMATPADLADFARGFSLAEGIVRDADEVGDIRQTRIDGGVEIHITIPENRMEKLRLHKGRRAHRGRAGCGICGVDRLSDALRPLPKLAASELPNADAILRAVDALPDHQVMRADNKTVHGAAWVDMSGNIQLVREDIGRHNALDKMIGARAKLLQQQGLALLSSRCTYELVQKCALSGISILVCLAAPTARAVETARAANMQLVIIDRKTRRCLHFA